MKNYKNIARTDFVNVNITLNLHSYEDRFLHRFILELKKRCIFCGSLNHKIQHTYDHITIILVLHTQHRTLLCNFFMKQYFFLNSNPVLFIVWMVKVKLRVTFAFKKGNVSLFWVPK